MKASNSINFLSLLSVHLRVCVCIHLFSLYPHQRFMLGFIYEELFLLTYLALLMASPCEVTMTILFTAEQSNAIGSTGSAPGRAAG